MSEGNAGSDDSANDSVVLWSSPADPSRDFEWIDIRSDSPGTEKWLQAKQLDQFVIDSLTATETRPKVISHDQGVVLVLRGVNTNPGADPEDMVAVRVWFDQSVVVTAHKSNRQLVSLQDIQHSMERGKGPATAGSFVANLAERLADRISEFVDDIDEQLTDLETDDTRPLPEARQELSELRRQTAAIRRYLAPQRDALDALYRARAFLTDDEAFTLREQSDRTTRYVEDLDLARERAMVMQEELQNRVAEQQNSRMYLLSIVTAIFLPLSFFTGIFGMNVGGMPGTEDQNGFVVLMSSLAVVTLGLFLFMKWKKWI